MPSALALLIFLPQFLALVGLFVGRKLAQVMGNCPHRGKVWGASVLPLIALPFAPEPVQLMPLVVSACAAIGAGLTAHSDMPKTFGATLFAVLIASALSAVLFQG
jgi:hypothetical protein